MKKTFLVLGSLVLIIFTGIFLVSFTLKQTRGAKSSPASLAKKESYPASTSSEDTTFYDAVGTSPRSTLSPARKQATRFTIELASFNTQAEAESLLIKLKSRGIEGFYTPLRRGGTVVYRVRLGMFSNPEDAKKVLVKVNAATRVDGVVAKLQ